MSSTGSETGIRIESWVIAVVPHIWRRLATALA